MRGIVMSQSLSELCGNVDRLTSDPAFLRLEHELSQVGIFSIVGKTDAERWYSALLAWLVNPSTSHGLGGFPLRCLLKSIIRKSSQQEGFKGSDRLPKLHDVELCAFEETEVRPDATDSSMNRELSVRAPEGSKRKRMNLDISLSTILRTEGKQDSRNRLLFVCENKVLSCEGKDQTIDYEQWVLNDASFPLSLNELQGGLSRNQDRPEYVAMLFLSPNDSERASGRAGSDWFVNMSYDDIVESVLYPCREHPSLEDRGRILLDEFFLNFVANGVAVPPLYRQLAEELWGRHAETLRLMAVGANEIKDEENDEGEDANVQSVVFVEDLVDAGLLRVGDVLVYHRKNTEKQVAIAAHNGTVGIMVDGKVHRAVSSAARCIYGSPCQGWRQFTLEKSGSNLPRQTLQCVRDEYRQRTTARDESSLPNDFCLFADAVFRKRRQAFQALELGAAELDADFALPTRYSRKSARNLDYSVLLTVLRTNTEDGTVEAFFKQHPAEVARIDLGSGSPTFYWEESGATRSGSGLQATRAFATRLGKANASGAYQWSNYWYVPEGSANDRRFEQKSFVQVHREITSG